MEKTLPKKIYWHANTSSGGTLSIKLSCDKDSSKSEKDKYIADALAKCVHFMEEKGYIPYKARLMSSSDIAEEFGKTRQYWEKLLNENKILYKETSAGRITTDLWVQGYLGNKEEVNQYVKNVNKTIYIINEKHINSGTIICVQCGKLDFHFHTNFNCFTNGICRSCNFHIHTTNN